MTFYSQRMGGPSHLEQLMNKGTTASKKRENAQTNT
jgi:hypothetical protein